MEEGTSPRAVLVVILILLCVPVSGKPASEIKQGPCVGMDCLHGVLMHGDAEQDGDHKVEDQYLRFKGVLKTKEDTHGPLNAEQEYHGVLMHGDTNTGQIHDEALNIQPEIKKEAMPKDMNEQMHEIMHGSEGVDKHEWDDKEEETNKNAGDHEKIMHGLLMHGDETHGKHDSSDSESSSEESIGVVDHEKLMHGLLMHGDINYGAHEPSKEPAEQPADIGPQTANELLHGVLMHGDKEPGQHHAHDDVLKDALKERMPGPSSDQLHGILMHGDSEIGHDHTEEDASVVQDVFSDFSKILEMDIDIELLKMIDLESILRDNIEEYEEWKINNPDHEDSKIMGSTYVDSSLLDDIALMKQRYLDKSESEDISMADDDIPFTAEDANSVLSSHSESAEGEDMRHDLELLGSTDPINDRHASKLDIHEET